MGAQAADWTHLGGDAAHTGRAGIAPFGLSVRWHVSALPGEVFAQRAAPVTFGERVFIAARVFVGTVHAANRVICFRASDGVRMWATDIDADVYDSWASPAIDVRHESVLVASGARLYALESDDGDVEWDTPLGFLVNASPTVSSDLVRGVHAANRAFIVDFSPIEFSTLYAINVDPFHATDNPYKPGDVVWTAGLSGSSGNTVAYADGRVHVSSTGGAVTAFNARDGGAPLFSNQLVNADPPYSHGFFGGVTVQEGYLYAASYDFDEIGNDSRLFKVNATTGALVWSVHCERTASIPIVSGGRIYLSAGIPGFGSSERLQAFQDLGASAALIWDTGATATGLGGWTHHPLLYAGGLFVGTSDGGDEFGPYISLSRIDVNGTPGTAGFVTATHEGAGASPAAGADGALYSVGEDGLFCFHGAVLEGEAELAEPAKPFKGLEIQP